MKVGDVCDGLVIRIEHYGLIVEVDGTPGLLRVPDLTSKHIAHPSDVASVGDTVRFEVFQLKDPARSPHEQFCGGMRGLESRPATDDLDAVD